MKYPLNKNIYVNEINNCLWNKYGIMKVLYESDLKNVLFKNKNVCIYLTI